MSDRGAPRVFVTYAHESLAHKNQVREFATFLRTAVGLDVHLDQWYDNRRRDWSTWAIEQLNQADFVLVIASHEYKRRADGAAPTDEGRGAQFEAAIIRDNLTKNLRQGTERVLPVVLPGQSLDDIPTFLNAHSTTHYRIDEFTIEGVSSLLTAITGHGQYPLPKRGEWLGGQSGPQLPDAGPAPEHTTRTESRSLNDYVADIDRICEFVPPRVAEVEKIMATKNSWSMSDRRSMLPVFQDLYDTLDEASERILAIEPPADADDRRRVEEWLTKYLKLRDLLKSAIFDMGKEMETRNPVKYIAYRVPADLGFYMIGRMWDNVRRTRQMLGITNCLP